MDSFQPARSLATLLATLGLLLATPAWAADSESAAAAETVHKSHAIAMHGEPKYPADFPYFEYVNPEAPKGGMLKQAATGTFDSFNPYIPKGNAASGMGFLNETLLQSSADEAFTEYGLIAESLEWPEDRSWVTFHLRPEARWHDGKPITVEDVIFSFNILKEKGHPFYRFYYQSVDKAEQVGEHSVKFTFNEVGNRELPLIVGQLTILPKHYWEGRDFESTTLEPPLGSGPYKIGEFEPGRYIIWDRVDDYWGKDLPINRGKYNFDDLRYEYYRDDTVVRESLKAGNIDYRAENNSKAWATDYNVPQVEDGLLRKEMIPHQQPTGMQAMVLNTRRPIFQDPLVRRALANAFDFEWTNRNLFYDQYTRSESYFSNSEMAATGLPEGEELEILEQYRGRVPDEVFTTTYGAPATDGSGWPRANLRDAFKLLEEAGWIIKDHKLVNGETGEPFRIEILIVSQAFERVVLPFVRNLKRLGIDARVRLVDQSQYINRLRSFDFDVVISGWGQSDSPGNEQRNYWGSQAADLEGSRNLIGIKDPVIDELIELIITAPDRESLITRTKALDRVLLSHHFVIPNWHISASRTLSWDKFGRPAVIPRQGTSTTYWWYDPEKDRALQAARGNSS